MTPTPSSVQKAREIYFKCREQHGGISEKFIPCDDCVASALSEISNAWRQTIELTGVQQHRIELQQEEIASLQSRLADVRETLEAIDGCVEYQAMVYLEPIDHEKSKPIKVWRHQFLARQALAKWDNQGEKG